jgi:hypothetical protein
VQLAIVFLYALAVEAVNLLPLARVAHRWQGARRRREWCGSGKFG